MAVGLHLKNTIAIRTEKGAFGGANGYANYSKQTNLR